MKRIITIPHPHAAFDTVTILQHWFDDPNMDVRPTSAGTNNATFFVATGGRRFILRVTTDPDAASRLPREMSLLRTLQNQQLPFQTPVPIKTRDGKWIAEESQVLATVFLAIEGSPVDRTDPSIVRQAGSALAMLDRALLHESIEAVTPLISPDELRAVRLEPNPALTSQDLNRTCQLMDEIAGSWEQHRSTFPFQAIHGDYYPANVLAHEGKLTGIIDFDLSLSGPRILDLAIGLWTFGATDEGFNWTVVENFAAGYAAILPVSHEEIAAIPDLIMLREAGSLAHWSKRYARGLIDDHELRWRMDRLDHVCTVMERTGSAVTDRIEKSVRT